MHINWWKLFLRWRTEGKCSILLCIFLHYLYLAAILVYIGILYWEWFENKWSFEKYIIYNIPSVHLQGAPVWKAVFPHMMSLYFPSKISACEWIIRLPVLPKIESWSSSFNRLFFPFSSSSHGSRTLWQNVPLLSTGLPFERSVTVMSNQEQLSLRFPSCNLHPTDSCGVIPQQNYIRCLISCLDFFLKSVRR